MSLRSSPKSTVVTEINSGDTTAPEHQYTSGSGATGDLSAGSTGLIVVDRNGECLYINSIAQQLLCYPKSLSSGGNFSATIQQQIRSLVLPLCNKSATGTLIFGRRTYLYRTLVLETNHAREGGTTAIVLERRSRRNENIRRVCERYKLTPRERQAFILLTEGLTSKEIAQRMNISAHTVKGFVHLIMLKLGVTTRAGIVGKINCA